MPTGPVPPLEIKRSAFWLRVRSKPLTPIFDQPVSLSRISYSILLNSHLNLWLVNYSHFSARLHAFMHRINILSTLNQIKHTTLFRRMTFVGPSLFFCVRCTVPYVESKEQSKLSNLEVGCEYNNVCVGTPFTPFHSLCFLSPLQAR